jgi:hypothetical protein
VYPGSLWPTPSTALCTQPWTIQLQTGAEQSLHNFR